MSSAVDATGRIDWIRRLAPIRNGLPPNFSSGATRSPRFIAPPLIASGPCVGATPPSTPAVTTRSDPRGKRERLWAAAGQAYDGHLVDAQRVGDGPQVVSEGRNGFVLIRR
ncbi:MAG: hypothetical protein QOH91_3780 [Mycobacterium sp.]|nr:hypothetical protein [Mycobacterium sp.]